MEMKRYIRNLALATCAVTVIGLGLVYGQSSSDDSIRPVTAPPRTVTTNGPITGYTFDATMGDAVQQQEESHREEQIHKLLEKYKGTKSQDDREATVKELDKILADQFDARQKERETELKQLEEQLKELRSIHDKRKEQKDTIVRERLRQLIREADGLGWNNQSTQRPNRLGRSLYSNGSQFYQPSNTFRWTTKPTAETRQEQR
jgi:hypothetical protein